MKISIIAIILSCLCLSTLAQKPIKRVNFELGVGMNFATRKIDSDKTKLGPTVFMDLRYNIRSLPIDAGLHISYSAFDRKYSSRLSNKITYKSCSFLATSNYIFRRGSRVEPFVGLGLGVAVIDGVESRTKFVAMPRVGVRFVKHISLSLDYEIINREHSHMNCKLGFYF